MKLSVVFLLFTLLLNFSGKAQISTDNPITAGKIALKAITSKDTNTLKELFANKLRQDIFTSVLITTDFTTKNALEFGYYDRNNYKLILIDTTSFVSNDYLKRRYNKINCYLRVDSTYLELSFYYSRNGLNNIVLEDAWMWDLSSGAEFEIKTQTENLEFQDLIYTLNKAENTFLNAGVRLKNNNYFGVDYIKFKVTLKQDGKEFFNRTLIYKQKIYAGDIVEIYIPELSNYFVGGKIDKAGFNYFSYIIDFGPKNFLLYKDKINRLKQIESKETNK